MGRLHHLKQTYPNNIEAAHNIKDVEFVLLNYNSQDDLDKWVRNHFQNEIESGLISYFVTTHPQNYISSHAKNVSHRLSTGDILVNLDADVFIYEPIFDEIRNTFSSKNKVIMVSESVDQYGHVGGSGKIAVRREDFFAVRGYDESIRCGWGCDDTSFHQRAIAALELEMIHFSQSTSKVINHDNVDRVKNFVVKDIELGNQISWQILQKQLSEGKYITNSENDWGQVPVQRIKK